MEKMRKISPLDQIPTQTSEMMKSLNKWICKVNFQTQLLRMTKSILMMRVKKVSKEAEELQELQEVDKLDIET